MGQYRCLNCGYHTTSPTTFEDGCSTSKRSCGFQVGRYEYDPEYEISESPDGSSRVGMWMLYALLVGIGVGAAFIAIAIIEAVFNAFGMVPALIVSGLAVAVGFGPAKDVITSAKADLFS